MKALRGAAAPLPVVAVMAAVLLLTAGLAGGVWVWPTAWAFLAVFGGVSMLASGLLAVLAPASFAVRQQGIVARPAKKQPLIDALGLLFYTACLLGWLVFIPLDVFVLRLAPPPGLAVQGLGAGLVVAGLAISYAAIGQNRFAAPTIHDQSGEGQQVIQTGLYGLVRHPFYAGMLLVYVGAGLWLGSYAAAVAAVAFLLMTLARIVIEERYLRRNLIGYDAYARRVRARLIPFVL